MPIGAVASLGSAAIGAGGSLLAANTQADAQKQALALQQKEFNTGRADLAPYRDVGQNALYTLAGFYGLPTPNSPGGPGAIQNALQNFTQTPDYQFAFQQGERALNNSLAARGLGVSGAGIKGAQEFGQGLASQQFTNYWNKLQGLAGMGQSAAAGSATLAGQGAQVMGNTIGNIGTAQGAGIVGAANSLSGGLNSLGLYSLLNRNSSSYGGGTGGNTLLSAYGSGYAGPNMLNNTNWLWGGQNTVNNNNNQFAGFSNGGGLNG